MDGTIATIETHPFAAAKYISEPEDLTKLAKGTGTNHQALHTALSENGNPALETLLKVLAALETRLKYEVGAARGAWQRSSKQRIASAEWQQVGGMTCGGAM